MDILNLVGNILGKIVEPPPTLQPAVQTPTATATLPPPEHTNTIWSLKIARRIASLPKSVAIRTRLAIEGKIAEEKLAFIEE